MIRSIAIFPFLLLAFLSLTSVDLNAQSWSYNVYSDGSDYWMTVYYKSDVVCDCDRRYVVSAYKDNYSPSNYLGSNEDSRSKREGTFKVAVGPSASHAYNLSLAGTGKNDFVVSCVSDCSFNGSGTLRRSTSRIKRPSSASATDSEDVITLSWGKGTDIPNNKHKYRIARDATDNIVATVSGSTRKWADVNVGPGERHVYYIYTYSTSFGGTDISSARTTVGYTRPRALRASTDITRRVALGWDDVSGITDQVTVRRNGEQIVTLDINSASDTSYTDSDAGLIPGYFYDYSLTWIKNDVEYGIHTTGATQPNGRISGQILTPLTQLPVANVQVCIEQENDIEQSEAGRAYCDTTDANGYYDIRRIYYHREATFRVTPFKDGHGFNPGSYENQLLDLDFPSLSLNFKDTTSFAVGGQVLQAMNGDSCGIGGIEIWVDGIYKGIKTKADGSFALSVEESGTYTIEPRLPGHEFVPAGQTLLIDRDTNQLSFVDTTTNFLAGAVQAACDIYIGSATVRAYSVGDNACLDTMVQTDAAGRYEVILPARGYAVEVVEFTPEAGLALDPDAVLAYFPTEEVDITDEGQEQDFIFRRPPEIRVVGLPANQCDQLGAYVVEQNRPYALEVEVIESFGDASCYVESGYVLVYDEAGDKANEPDTLYLEEGKATYQMIPGRPNLLAPHHKLLQMVAHVGQETTEWSQNMLVTGVRPREQTFATVLPEIPLMVVHDPPGDASFSFFEEGRQSEFGLRLFAQAEGSLTVQKEVKLGNRFSAGQFITTETAYWGTVGGSLSLGARVASQTELVVSTTSLERFSTSNNQRITGAEGDVFVGAAMNLIYALADVVDFDPATCSVATSVDMIMGNDGFATTFLYTEDHIRATLLPQLSELRDLFLDTNPDSARIYDNQISVWQQVLENNQRNKRNADMVENRSFSAGAIYASSLTSDTLSSGSIEVSAFLEESIVLGAGYEVAGTGASGSVETKLRLETGGSVSGSFLKSTTTGFELSDDDPGDFFSVNIKRDPVYGTPVFDLVSGRSSCPWEAGTQPREALQLQADSYIQSGVPADEAAVFELSIGNISQSNEARTYVLKFLQESNPGGAYVTIGGSEAQAPIPYTLGAGTQRGATVTVRRGPRAFDYQGLQFVLASGCEDEVIADTVALSVSFESAYPAVEMARPAENWLVNEASNHELLVRFLGYDRDRVQKVQLQYKPSGGFAWETGAEWQPDDLSDATDGTTLAWDVVNLMDGKYDVRIRADYGDGDVYSAPAAGVIDRRAPQLFGLPEPADGALQPGDVVATAFDEPLDCFAMSARNVTFESLTTGDFYPVELGCSEGKLILKPLWNANQHLGETIRVRLSNAADRYGNLQTEPVVWTFVIRGGTGGATTDTDTDGLADIDDNCPLAANGTQSDTDGDGLGDACDDDIDGDGILNADDNCPYFANPDQADVDNDGVGDLCEPTADGDGDGIPNGDDNCPYTPNADQSDIDGDGVGDVCDEDADGDGLLNFADNCAFQPNPEQTDSDGNLIGDACQNATSVREEPASVRSFLLFPNPVREVLTVEMDLAEPGRWRFELLDVTGRVQWRRDHRSYAPGRHTLTVDAAGLAGGLYLMRMVSEGGVVSRKVVRSR